MTKESGGKTFLLNGKRTPFGSFGGSLKDITPVELSVLASKALIEQSQISPEKIDHVILANVVNSTSDTIYGSRHLGLKIGTPIKTPAFNVNRLCGSGIEAILQAKRLIDCGEAHCVLVSGTENMSMIPHLTYGARFGTKYGALKNVDLLLESLTDAHCNTPMGITAENLAQKYEITREDCEKYSVQSHLKVNEAYEKGHFEGEIISVQLKRGEVKRDEHFRANSNVEEMQKLRTSFKKDGVVTPATASGIVDGAAAVLIVSEKFLEETKATALCEIVDGKVVGVEPSLMGIGPAPAISKLLKANELGLGDISLFEINEAFASQVMACKNELGIPDEKLNIWGGAIALGHPLGATGTRISLTLARQLDKNNGKLGVASACIGGGQGIAMLIKSMNG